METIKGNYTCPHCLRTYKWQYYDIPRSRISDPYQSYQVFTMEKDTYPVTKDDSLSDEDKYRFNCDCPYCNEPNSFDYIISKG